MSNQSSFGINPVSQPSPTENILFLDDMKNFANNVGPASAGRNYFYFNYGSSNADDGAVSYSGGALTVNSVPFTKVWTPTFPDPNGALGHVYYLVYRKDPVPLPSDGTEFTYEGSISVQQTIGNLPIQILPGITRTTEDIRIASAAMNVIDFSTFVVFDVFFSDEMIYALYERLPFGKPLWGGNLGDYHAFTHVIPIAHRKKTEFSKVAITINRKESTVKWSVDGVEKFKISRIGYPLDRTIRLNDHGGVPELVDLKSVSPGFGTFSLMDFSNPVTDLSLNMALNVSISATNPLLMLGPDTQYQDPHRTKMNGSPVPVGQAPEVGGGDYLFLKPAGSVATDALFGNGAVINIQYLKGSYSNPLAPVSQTPAWHL